MRVDLRRLVALGLALASLEAWAVQYFIVASNGTSVGADGNTNVPTGGSTGTDVQWRTLFSTTNGATASSVQTAVSVGGSWFSMARVYLSSNYTLCTTVSGGTGSIYVRSSSNSDQFEFILKDYDPNGVAGNGVTIATSGPVAGSNSLAQRILTFTGSGTIPAGHRLMMEVMYSPVAGGNWGRFQFNSTGTSQASITVNETTVPTTTIGNGTNPGNTTQLCPAPAGAATLLDAFTLATSSGTDSISTVTANLTSGVPAAIGLVEILNSGGTPIGSVTDPAANPVTVTVSTTSINSTPASFSVRITPKSHANMPAPPGTSYAVTGTVSNINCSNCAAYQDTASATVTIDNASPADATGFTATPGDGQVSLGWTNPGADFTEVIVLRYTATITDAPVEGQTYSVGNTLPGGAIVRYVGSGTAATDSSGVTNGIDYWYKIFSRDACVNWAGGVQVGPVRPSPPNARIVYGVASNTPADRRYTSASNLFATAGTTVAGATNQTFVVNRAAANRNERMAGYVTTAGALYVMLFNGSTWANTAWSPITVGGAGVNGRRFDIAYEQATGNAMVAYSTNLSGSGANSEIAYRVWNGTSWAGPTTLDLTQVTGVANSLKLASRPGTNELALTVADVNLRLETIFWSGSGWGNEAQHTTVVYRNAAPGDADSFDGAYESLTGDFFVAYNTTTPQQFYRRYQVSGGWQAATSWATGFIGYQMIAVADPKSDRILFAFANTNNTNINARVWSGSAMSAVGQAGTTGIAPAINRKTITGGFLTSGAATAAVVTWMNSAGTNNRMDYGYTTNDGTAWTTNQTWTTGGTSPAQKYWMDADMDPQTPTSMMVTFADSASDLWAKRLVFTAPSTFTWSNSDSGGALTTTLSSATTQNFMFAYDRYYPLNRTAAGTVTAGPSGCSTIAAGATYSDDLNANNTLSYKTRTPAGSGPWVGPTTVTHQTSPYAFTISSLTFGATYDVEVTYVDTDGISSGTATQTVSNILVGGDCTGAGTVTASETTGATPSIAVSAPYTFDNDGSNSLSYKTRTPSGSGGWSGAVPVGHQASSYSVTIGSLTCGASYDVEVTYIDDDGLGSGTAVQTVSNILVNQCTSPGTASGTAACEGIDVSAPYTNDSNSNNTCTVDYKLSSSGTWLNWANLSHAISPYTTTISGLAGGTSYDVRVTWNDADAVVATSPQTFSRTPLACNGTTAGTVTATRSACGSIAVSAPYSGDTNTNNTCTVEYREVGAGTWTLWANLAHAVSPYSTTITGLNATKDYEVQVTYNDTNGVGGTNPQVVGPYARCSTIPGAVTHSDACNAIALTIPYTGDSNGNNTCTVEYKLSSDGTWTLWNNLPHTVSPYTTTITGLSIGGTYDVRTTFTDSDTVNGTNPQVVSGIVLPGSCIVTLSVSDPGQPAGGSVAAGSTGTLVGVLQASVDYTSAVMTGFAVTNGGSAVPDSDIQSFQLFDDTDFSGTLNAGDTLLSTSYWTGSVYSFGSLAYTVVVGVPRKLFVTLNVATGATTGNTISLQTNQSRITVGAPNLVANFSYTGNTFTVAAGPGSGGTVGSAPTVLILNPGNGSAVSGTFLVQVQVYSPGGLANLSTVKLSTNGGADAYSFHTFNLTTERNANYGVGTNAAVYETQVSLAPGAYSLKVEARNNLSQTATSTVAVVTVNEARKGDGMLLVRDNSSQMCIDCHALQTHSSQGTGTKYGSWAVGCRDCHTPHNTTNIYLVRKKITPPPVNGYDAERTVKFSTKTGDSASASVATASFANSDNSGPCQVCHTRTASGGGTPRWRNTGNADTHWSAGGPDGTAACITCHSHSSGFKGVSESEGGGDCVVCHSSLVSPMKTTSGNHHFIWQGWAGTTYGAGEAVYPTSVPSSSQTDVNRRCLMCHVDHDLFRSDLNPTNGGRGKNLRTDIGLQPDSSNNFTNKDFDSALDKGGICISCHENSLTKAYAQGDGTTTTPIVSKSEYTSSAHNYGATGTLAAGGTNSFVANCSKCHTDTMNKLKPDGTTQIWTSSYPLAFGLHDSTLRSINDPLGLWNPYPGGTLPTDPIEENFCYQCHRRSTDAVGGGANKPAANKDYFNVANMSNRAELIYNMFTSATYGFKHPVASTTGTHKVTGDSVSTRHVTCADCHSAHGAQPCGSGPTAGTITGYATNAQPTDFDVLTDNTKGSVWTANQWKGYTVTITSTTGAGAGVSSTIYSNTTTELRVEFATAPAVGQAYAIHRTGIAATSAPPPTGPVVGAPGVIPSFPTQPTPPNWNDSGGTSTAAPFTGSTVYNTITFTPTDTAQNQGQICIRCHSSYAYGASPPNTPSGLPNSTNSAWVNTVGGNVAQGDRANEFNPNNLAHHAVFARGKNQPLKSGVASTFNCNWPRFVGGGAVLVSAPACSTPPCALNLASTTWPVTTLPGWFIFVGTLTAASTGGNTCAFSAPPQNTTGFYEITSVPSTTQLLVDRAIPAGLSNQNFFLTAGLGNNFVPPWGPWSTLECTDCHASNIATDPFGPHGSATKWLLRSAVAQTFSRYNGTGSTPTNIVQVTSTPLNSYHFCLNCHWREIYGDYNWTSQTSASYARVNHANMEDGSAWQDLPKWGILCMNCHGGARTGGIHGLNVGKGNNGVSVGSYSGKRFLAGSTWYGVTRATTSTDGQCWTKGSTDAVDNCAHSHGGSNMGTANYSFDDSTP